MDCYHK